MTRASWYRDDMVKHAVEDSLKVVEIEPVEDRV